MVGACMVFTPPRWAGVGVWHRVGARQIHDRRPVRRARPPRGYDVSASWTPEERALLRPVIDAARRELRDRTADDVPARLRRVAASSARSLPPPLEKALVDVLVDDRAFREAVAKRWQEAGTDGEIADAFLEDPEAAHATARGVVAAGAERAREARETRDRERIEDLERRLAEAKDRLATVRRDAESALTAQREADRSARAQLVDAARTAERTLEATRERLASLEAERDDLAAHVVELEERLGSLRRRRSSPRPVPGTVTGGVPFSASDPMSLARHLDRVERMARPFRHAEVAEAAETGTTEYALPAGVAPDAAEAIDALIDGGTDLFVIDGYNLSGTLLGPGGFDRDARALVEVMATSLVRRSGARVTVVFDAAQVEGRSASMSDLGVESVFAQGGSADDEIVTMCAATDARLAIVSNDRELRERCAVHGAIAVWSDALIAWSNR